MVSFRGADEGFSVAESCFDLGAPLQELRKRILVILAIADEILHEEDGLEGLMSPPFR